MEHHHCKSIDELDIDKFKLSTDFRTNFVDRIGLSELVFDIRYHAVLCEDQTEEIIESIFWEYEYDSYYGFEGIDIRKYEADLISFYHQLKDSGFLRHYSDFTRTVKLYHIFQDGNEYWEDLLDKDDADERNYCYENEHQLSQGELTAILKIFQAELPFLQYEMLKFSLTSTIEAVLSDEEKILLKLAIVNAGATKDQVTKLLGAPLF